MSSSLLRDIIAAVLAVGALGVVAYLAIVMGHEAAAGAVIAVLSAAAGWYLRGRVREPTG